MRRRYAGAVRTVLRFARRLIPPLSPTSSAQEIAAFFVDHKLRVRIGVVLTALFTAFFMPFLTAICLRIRRIEGTWGVLSITQIFGGVVFVPGFMFPMMILATAVYWPEQRPVEITSRAAVASGISLTCSGSYCSRCCTW